MREPWGIIARVMCAGAIGVAAGKLLPAPMIAVAALLLMVWAVISLRQLKRMQAETEKLLRRQKLVTEFMDKQLWQFISLDEWLDAEMKDPAR